MTNAVNIQISEVESLVKRSDGWYLNIPDVTIPVFIKNQKEAELLFNRNYGHLSIEDIHYPVNTAYHLDCVMNDWPVAILHYI